MSKCETCGGELITNCLLCGAPVCCYKCCEQTTAEVFNAMTRKEVQAELAAQGIDVAPAVAKVMDTLAKDHEHDWQGRWVHKPTGPDEKITVWEVTPHVQTDKCDGMVERGWQEMLSTVGTGLDAWLERYTEEELREGVTLTFKLVDMNADEMPDDSDVI